MLSTQTNDKAPSPKSKLFGGLQLDSDNESDQNADGATIMTSAQQPLETPGFNSGPGERGKAFSFHNAFQNPFAQAEKDSSSNSSSRKIRSAGSLDTFSETEYSDSDHPSIESEDDQMYKPECVENGTQTVTKAVKSRSC